MRSFFSVKRVLLTLLVLMVILLAVAAQQFRLFERIWFNATSASSSQTDAIWLSDYRVSLEAKVIEGLEDDISALTFDPDRRTLFTVTNTQPQLIELSLDGRVLRRIDLVGFGDAEAVEYIRPNVFVITDERRQRLLRVEIDDNTKQINADQTKQFSLSVGGSGNKGFEGLAYDSVGKRLYVAKERDPVRILEITGFAETNAEEKYSVHVADNIKRDKGLFVRDLSSLQFDERTGHLLALSDESSLVIELDADGKPISTLSLLRRQHGLKASVPQAEGVAMDDNGVLYLISEPNLFYVFEKKTN
ncbi:SdiA-regulated domain-containing protein [Pseudomonas sp. M30-35]|uniref:SdiA-regulated domain-containing protein n=1 Tax=Pseudomonas sp. M30-35 TaxID=1981174 RepID=UPI000B3C03C2|nr:SdiA-regulated domain-containing protein [Pseudomonas sp. M30-35]ARU86766.1 DNA-binding protein [Pseudomonas sp. M30-35]